MPQSKPFDNVDIELGLVPQYSNLRHPASSAGAIGRPAKTTTAPSVTTLKMSANDRIIHKCMEQTKGSYTRRAVSDGLHELRRRNNNTLTGLAEDVIIDRLQIVLQSPSEYKSMNQTPIAPWANVAVKKPSPRKPTSPQDKEECSICIEPMKNRNVLKQLDCGHFFHSSCIEPWLQQKRDCPICRRHTVNKTEFPPLAYQ